MEPKLKPRRKGERYDEAFKRDCVALWEQSDKTMKAMAAELGIAAWNLREWRQRYQGGGKPVEPGAQSSEGQETELRRLRRENESLRAQRDILKKALGIVADGPTNATRG
jgi:transposase